MSSELPPAGDLIKQSTETLSTFVRWIAELIVAKNWFTLLILMAIANLFLFKLDGGIALKGIKSLFAITPLPTWYSPVFWAVEGGLILGALTIAIRTLPKAAQSAPVQIPNYKAIKGLRPFTQDDAEVFAQLQRQGNLRACIDSVTSPGFRFGILHGVSGCGKTSFLQAGLLPRLSTMETTHRAIYVRLGGQDPVRAIASALSIALEIPSEWLLNDTGSAGFRQLLNTALNAAEQPLILFLDQFEQFFVYYPREEQRQPFVQALTAWYTDPHPLRISFVIAVRSDLLYQLDELHKALGYALAPQEVFRLEKFTPTETTNVLRAIAQLENLSFDARFITELAGAELADRDDGRISPVDVQILAWMIEQQPQGELRAFDRNAFQKFGGVEGLLQRFLERTLEARMLPKQRESALKVLLALTDLARQVRAGVLTKIELANKLKDTLSADEVTEATQWLARGDVRLVTPQEREGVVGYELAHERLIPALLRQTQKELTDVERARQLLDRRVNEWLGNQRDRRYLFGLRELWLIGRQRPYLDWGAKREQKEKMIRLSRRHVYGTIAALLLLISTITGFTGWLRLTPQGQLQGMYWQLNSKLANASTYEVSSAALAFAKNNQWDKAFELAQTRLQPKNTSPSVSQDADMSTFIYKTADTLIKSTLSKETQRQWLKRLTVSARAIKDGKHKSYALCDIATAYAQLNDQAKAADILEQALSSAQVIPYEEPKFYALRNIATVYTQLDDQVKATDILKQALTSAQSITADGSKSSALRAIASTSAQLDDRAKTTDLLKQALSSAQVILYEGSKSYALSGIAHAYAQLEDQVKAVTILKQALISAQATPYEEPKSSALRDIAHVSTQILDDEAKAADILKQILASAQAIQDDRYKSSALSGIAYASAKLDDQAKATDILKQTLTSAQTIPYAWYKSPALSDIAYAYAQLHDQTKAIDILKQALTSAQATPDNRLKSDALSALAYPSVQLSDRSKAADLLKQTLISAQTITADKSKSYALQSIAFAAAQLHNPTDAAVILKQALTNAQTIQNDWDKSDALRAITAASWALGEVQTQQSLFSTLQEVARKGNHRYVIQQMVSLYAKQGQRNRALSLLRGYGDVLIFSRLLTIQAENRNPTLIDGAVVLRVAKSGNPGDYTLEVTLKSLDQSCDYHASWWEVITPDGKLLARKVLDTIHRDKQLFTSQLSSINIAADQDVLIRAYYQGSYGSDLDSGYALSGYTDQALHGSIKNGFKSVRLSPDFARWLEKDDPQPERCIEAKMRSNG